MRGEVRLCGAMTEKQAARFARNDKTFADAREGKPDRASRLADGATHCDRGTARDACANQENQEEDGCGADCGASQEVDQNVV